MAEAGKRGTRGKKAAVIPDPDLLEEEVTESKAIQGKKVKEPPKTQQEFENGVHTMPKKVRGKKAPAAAVSEESGKSETESSAEDADSDYKEEKVPKKGPTGKKAAPKKGAAAKKAAESEMDMEMPAPTNGVAEKAATSKKTIAKSRAASKTKVTEAEPEDAMNGDTEHVDEPDPAPAKRGGRGKKESPTKKLKTAKEEEAMNGGGDAHTGSVDEEAAPKRGGRGKKVLSAPAPMDEVEEKPKAMKAGRGKK